MKILSIIPARGGSKGIPNKNVQDVNGIPLIAYSINYALNCDLIDKIVVSTDCEEIKKVSLEHGAEVVLRPEHLATDTSLVIDAIKYTVTKLKEDGFNYDLVLLLEPTSPIRSAELVTKAVEAIKGGYSSAATFSVIDPPPGRLWRLDEDRMVPLLNHSDPFIRRQDHSHGYKLTGQLYAFTTGHILSPKSRSVISDKLFPILVDEYSVDIDTRIDLLVAETLIKENEKFRRII